MSEVAIAYGMTETSPVSCQTLIDDDLQRRTATVGRAHPHVEIKIVDPDTGEIVKRGEPGEFCTRGYSVMLGYWRDDDRTREAVDARRLDAHRRSRRHAGRRVLHDRRANQGHGDPRRRERVPARDRGVPLHPPRYRRRTGDRRSRRKVRRGDLRVDQDAAGQPGRWTPTPCGHSPPASSRTTKFLVMSTSSTSSR